LIICAVAINAINLLPVADSPYLGDDSWRESCLNGMLDLTGSGFLDICWLSVVDSIKAGRWYPLVFYYYALFRFLDLYSYKVLTILLVICNVILFGVFVRMITRSMAAALVSLLLCPMVFQHRLYHDPILGYYCLMQVEFLLIIGSLILFCLYLEGRSRLFQLLSVSLFVLSLLVYEAFHLFCIMYFVIALVPTGNARRALAASAPFLATALINAIIIVVIRYSFNVHYDGITAVLDPHAWLAALAKQVVAALPLSYFVTADQSSSLMEFAKSYISNDLFILLACWSIFWCMCAEYSTREKVVLNTRQVVLIMLIAVGFLIVPAILVSASAKYQRELTWGLGYLPVYVSAFGVTLFLTLLVSLLGPAMRSRGRGYWISFVALTSLLGAVVSGITYANNRMVIHLYNCSEHHHRALVEKGMRSGLFSGVPAGSYLICGNPVRSWDSPSFFREHSGLSLQVIRPAGFAFDGELGIASLQEACGGEEWTLSTRASKGMNYGSGGASRYEVGFVGAQSAVVRRVAASGSAKESTPFFFLKYEAHAEGLGFAVLGRVTRIKNRLGASPLMAADKIRIYVGIPMGLPHNKIVVTGRWLDQRTMQFMEAFRLTDEDLTKSSSDDFGKIVEVQPSSWPRCIDPRSVTVTVSMSEY